MEGGILGRESMEPGITKRRSIVGRAAWGFNLLCCRGMVCSVEIQDWRHKSVLPKFKMLRVDPWVPGLALQKRLFNVQNTRLGPWRGEGVKSVP